jgi:hypothetical protein
MKTYGLFDLLFAGLYAWFGFVFTPSRSTSFNAALGTLVGLLILSGIGLFVGARWGRLVAIVTSSLLLVFAAVVVLGMVASSAYLRGVYGPLGRGMAVMSLLIAALVVEAFALLPLFQLRFLLSQRRA